MQKLGEQAPSEPLRGGRLAPLLGSREQNPLPRLCWCDSLFQVENQKSVGHVSLELKRKNSRHVTLQDSVPHNLAALGLTANYMCCPTFPFTHTGRERSTDLTFLNLSSADLVSFHCCDRISQPKKLYRRKDLFSLKSTSQTIIAERSRRQELEAVSPIVEREQKPTPRKWCCLQWECLPISVNAK